MKALLGQNDFNRETIVKSVMLMIDAEVDDAFQHIFRTKINNGANRHVYIQSETFKTKRNPINN